ncbi:hypothetical protein IPC508_01130 [Pseudomonas aeruginosa]|uniref:hypothetical protein n=1 Tax=Pseudomonas aeruginosa TaxID=287 RepID=UPI000F52C3F5|nr:hypothetical protein [Pseudomonas aeruginosa]RQA21191.1 hypothetical protein IPC508_01130 [Pseudomonas aeruginosa]
MQVQTPEVSGTKATTARTRPTMASQRLDLPSICDICGTARSTRKHAACSRIRQQLKRDEWATYMANLTAKKAQGGRHYAR